MSIFQDSHRGLEEQWMGKHIHKHLIFKTKGTIQFKIQMFQVGGGAGWRWELRKTSDNSVVASGQNDTSLI